MRSVILSREGCDFLQLFEDKTVINLRTGTEYFQNQPNTLVVWWNGRSHTIGIDRYWRKYFACEINDVDPSKRRRLDNLGFPLYEITDDGRIWNWHFYTWQKLCTSTYDGYVHAKLTNRHHVSKDMKVHRLVKLAFDPIEHPERFEVDHINGVKTDNRLCNLDWVTTLENNRRARARNLRPRALTDEDVHKFCKMWSESSHKNVARCAKVLSLPTPACRHIIDHGTHREISSLYGIPYKKPVRLTPVNWKLYPKSKYLKRPVAEQSVASTPSNCEDRLNAPVPQT